MAEHTIPADQIRQQVIETLMAHFAREKEKKLTSFRQQNAYIRKGQVLFTGSLL